MARHGRKAAPPAHDGQTAAEQHSDTLSALIFYHAADYFVYKGTVIGFQYELLNRLARDLGRTVRIDIETDPNKAFAASFTDRYDIVSMDYNKQVFTPQYITQSEPNSYTYPVLVMRRNTPLDGDGKKVIHLAENYYNPVNLQILGQPGRWTLSRDAGPLEDLFTMLADSAVDFLICNHNVALTMLPFYENLTLGPRMGDIVTRSWILNEQKPGLNDTINQWLIGFKMTDDYVRLCKKYLSRESKILHHSFGTRNRDKISHYDALLKEVCSKYGVDWRFVSSVIYQESRFTTDVLGMGGSYGIMQMMPETYRQYGMSDTAGVEEQIRTGVKHISLLYKSYKDSVSPGDLYCFVAAAYNAGAGHIQDAVALCRKYGGNPAEWASVAVFLKLKSQKKYYSDPVVKAGHYPGNHTVRYVSEVMDRYRGYLTTKKTT